MVLIPNVQLQKCERWIEFRRNNVHPKCERWILRNGRTPECKNDTLLDKQSILEMNERMIQTNGTFFRM